MRLGVVSVMVVLLSGCIGQGQWGANAGWSNGRHLGDSALRALKDPKVWVPVATAGLIIAADVDHQWSKEIAQNQKLFNGHGDSQSNDLRDIATAAYVLTALLAPSETVADKAKGMTVGVSTAVVNGLVTHSMKQLVGRERPDESNDNGMPSGHASKASVRSAMALYNLKYINMPQWSYQLANWSLQGVALGTGLARVEAEKHHLSDVLVGYAVGQFLASFMYQGFFEGEHGAQISFEKVPSGGALTLTVPLR